MKNNMLLVGGGVLITILLLSSEHLFDNYNGWELTSALTSIIVGVFFFAVWKMMKFEFWSPTFFVIFSLYMFHLSTLALLFFDHSIIQDEFVLLFRYESRIGFLASLYSSIFIVVFIMGCVSFKKNTLLYKVTNESIDPNILKQTRRLGLFLFFISFPPELYHVSMQIITRKIFGYAEVDATVGSEINGIPIGFLFNLFIPSILLILSSYRNNKRKFTIIALIWGIYYVALMFFTGRKGSSILAIIPVLFMYCLFYRIKFKLIYAVALYILLVVMSMTTLTRFSVMDSSFSSNIAETYKKNDPIRDICLEMGGTIKGPIQAMMAVKDISDFRFGLTYPACFLDILNEYLGFDNKMIGQYAKFNEFLSDPSRGAEVNDSVYSMGGSMIAEWYWNFGWIGVPLVYFLAFFICRYESIIYKKSKNPIQFAVYLMLLHFILKWTRGYFYDVVWLSLYTYIVISIFRKLFVSKKYYRFT